MKPTHPSLSASQMSTPITTLLNVLTSRKHRHPIWILLALCLNLAIAPAVLAATQGTVDRGTAYAIGLLGMVTLGLAIYLFAVILQPERF